MCRLGRMGKQCESKGVELRNVYGYSCKFTSMTTLTVDCACHNQLDHDYLPIIVSSAYDIQRQYLCERSQGRKQSTGVIAPI